MAEINEMETHFLSAYFSLLAWEKTPDDEALKASFLANFQELALLWLSNPGTVWKIELRWSNASLDPIDILTKLAHHLRESA